MRTWLALFLVFAAINGSFAAWYLFTPSQLFSPQPSLRVEAVNGSIKLIMSVDKAEFGLGETINVNLTIENVGESEITLVWCYYYILDFVVYDGNFKKTCAWSQDQLFPEMVREISLKAGESHEEILSWRQNIYDMITDNSRQVGPGVYYLEGVLVRGTWIYSENYVKDRLSHEELRTPMLKITILP